MTNAKHTPGPWISDESVGGKLMVVSEENDALIADRLSEGNARLIAAAPELLAALEKALAALETCTPADYSTGHVIHASFDDAACAWAEETARAAIAKARGEA